MSYRCRQFVSTCVFATLAGAFFNLASIVRAQTVTTLYEFGSNAGDPLSPRYPAVLTQGRDGNLYSTAPLGGANGNGAAYRISPGGTFSVVHSFLANKSEGANCWTGLNLGRDGNFYGACYEGSSLTWGTVYSLTSAGTYELIHAFQNATTDGAYPWSAPIQALDNKFYGVTAGGGIIVGGPGSVYRTDASGGAYKMIYGFYSHAHDGNAPISSPVQGTDKYLYAVAQGSGANGYGAVVKISTTGSESVIYSFSPNTDGGNPTAGLIQAGDGNFYGCTPAGGLYTYGTVYRVSAKGVFKVLHHFAPIGSSEGTGCNTVPVQATDGVLYGVQPASLGTTPGGVIYKIDLQGNYSVLHRFGSDIAPVSVLYQHTNGKLYGVTHNGGLGNGEIFSLDIGAHPFARLELTSGVAGNTIGIFGQGFLTATGVTFGGVAASFTAAGDNYMTVTVPTEGKSGSVVVQMPSGNLTSSKTFKLVPTISSFTPTQGPVGTVVTINGTGLVQTKRVTFGGVAATTFTVNSGTQITATVPAGALTGNVSVTTAGGSASKTKFTVTP